MMISEATDSLSDFEDKRDFRWIDQLSKPAEHIWKHWHRFSISGLEHIPKGPALYVGNHNGGLFSIDTFLFVNEAYRKFGIDVVPYGLAHDFLMRAPIKSIVEKIGGVRAGHEVAAKLFESGRKVLVYPGGDVDSMRPFRERNRVKFEGRTGYIRLALKNNVPIIPLVAHGAQGTTYVLSDNQFLARWLRLDKLFRVKVLPLMLTIPWGITLGPSPPYIPFPSKITMEVLPPIYFDRSGDAAVEDADYVAQCSNRVWSSLQETLTRLAASAGDANEK